MSDYFKDLAERVARTFAGGFLAATTIPQITSLDVSALQAGAFAGWSAVAALGIGIVAKWVGSSDSASFSSR